MAVGDEGGFAPNIANEEEAIQLIMEAITKAGYSCGRGKQFMILWMQPPVNGKEMHRENIICRNPASVIPRMN